ncbi:hypothetical protein [Actinoplanes sp. NPDC049265]|uniref:hypothetical protein n=1 Tax=Actinoplanes sp. NPDC049265 TaxID=3363902 RepID=UPI0037219ABD
MSYRPLLIAYPARFRRHHGTELLTTLSDMGTPSRTDLWHVVLDGVRERFRLPAGRPRPLAVLATVLAVLVGGALGAAAGSAAGSLTYADLPSPEPFAAMAMEPGGTSSVRSSGDDYWSLMDGLPAGTDVTAVAQHTRQRLSAAGWAVGPVTRGQSDAHFNASHSTVEVDVYVSSFDQVMLQISGWPTRPAAYLWLSLAGALLGLVAGWLLAAAAAHRIAAARRRGLSTGLALAGLLALIPPATMFTMSLVYYLTSTEPVGSEGIPEPGVLAPTLGLARRLGLTGDLAVDQWYQLLTFLGLAALVVAMVLSRPGPATPAPDIRPA